MPSRPGSPESSGPGGGPPAGSREATGRPGPSPQGGFTLLELMLAVAVAAFLLRLVVINAGALIPGSQVDSEAHQLAAVLTYVRSEARLNGKPYRLRLDLDRNRYRIVLPPEDQMAQRRYDEPEERALGWTNLDRNVALAGVALGPEMVVRSEEAEVTFDALGYTADLAIFIRHAHDPALARSIHVPGLGGEIHVLDGGSEGREIFFPSVMEGTF